MTDAQLTKFYLPNWTRCANALGWRMQSGCLTAARQPVHGHPTSDALYQQVWSMAEQFAMQSQRAVRPDDLRHAVNYVATNRVSAKEMNSAQANRAVALMKLLADPDNLAAVTEWSNPDLAEKRGLLERLSFHRAYAVNIARDQFGTADLDALDVGQLRKLVWTVTNRHRAKARKTREETQPF